jgi:hypothetical protein
VNWPEKPSVYDTIAQQNTAAFISGVQEIIGEHMQVHPGYQASQTLVFLQGTEPIFHTRLFQIAQWIMTREMEVHQAVMHWVQ